MKIYCSICFLIGFAMLSCSEKSVAPDNIWAEDKMIDVLVDMELAQATVKLNSATQNSKQDYKVEFEKVYTKYNITQEEFNENIEYYCQLPLNTRQMYDSVIVRLSEQQAELNKARIKEKLKEVDD
jgi:hypothetical protein